MTIGAGKAGQWQPFGAHAADQQFSDGSLAPRCIAVVGPPGVGKSRLAAVLSRATGAPHIPLDELRWPTSGETASDCEFASAVACAARKKAWVMEGAEISPPVLEAWRAAELIIWLDHGAASVAWRFGVECCHLLMSHFTPQDRTRPQYLAYQLRKLWRSWRCRRRLQRRLPGELGMLASNGVRVIQLRSVHASREWLRKTVPQPLSGYSDWRLWPWQGPDETDPTDMIG